MKTAKLILEEQIRISEERLKTAHYPKAVEPSVIEKIASCKKVIELIDSIHPEQSEQKKEVVDWDEVLEVYRQDKDIYKIPIDVLFFRDWLEQHYAIPSSRTVSLKNYLRDKLHQQEEMHDYSVATETVRVWIEQYESPKEEKEVAECEHEWVNNGSFARKIQYKCTKCNATDED